jgi:hypothetical protein
MKVPPSRPFFTCESEERPLQKLPIHSGMYFQKGFEEKSLFL